LVGHYGQDNDVVTRFFIAYAGTAPTSAQLVTFANAVGTAWGTNLKSLCSSQVELTSVTAEDLTSATAAVGASGFATLGTRAGDSMTAQLAAVVSYTIARRYRGGHPRGYWPFGVDTDIATPQTWANAFITASNTGIEAFFTAVLAAGWTGAGALTHVNVSYYHGFTVVTNPTTGRARNVPTLRGTPLVDTVSAAVTQVTVGTQRRRA
jgi:hypothetical protein